jgi:hypothetical protein
LAPPPVTQAFDFAVDPILPDMANPTRPQISINWLGEA